MGLGQGIIDGIEVSRLLGVRPGDQHYVNHNGATYTPQNDNDNGNVALYEINDPTDEIIFKLPPEAMEEYDEVKMSFSSIFGSTDFSAYSAGKEMVSEQSGFDSDNWIITLTTNNKQVKLTDFNTANGVDGTQAAWYPYVFIHEPTEY